MNKKYILKKAKKTLNLLSINGINIAAIGIVLKGSDLLINSGFEKPPVLAFKCFLTAGILSVNLAYNNYNIHKCNINEQKFKIKKIDKN